MDPIALEKAFEIYPDVKLVVYAELYGFLGNYNIPVLFHMDSTISSSAILMPGCIVEPRAAVGCGSTIGQATVVGANTVVEPYSFIGDSCTLKSGTIVKSTSVLEMGTETE